MATLRAAARGESASQTFRIAVTTSTIWGIVGIAIIGLGNVLMGDDALGPWVIHHLETVWDVPPEVALVDVGTPGLDLVPYVAGPAGIVLVDTVSARDAAPGTLRTFDREALLRFAPKPRLSPHDPGVTEALLAVVGEGRAA